MEHRGCMENNGMKKEDLVQCDGNSMKSAEGNSCSSGDPTKGETEHIMVLKKRRMTSGKKQLFLPNVCALDNKIPKYIITLDEKYILRCLEWVHASAFGANSCKISTNMGMISSSLNSGGLNYRSTLDMASFTAEYPLFASKNDIVVTDDFSTSPTGGCILGTISSSKSMMNILRSPLLHQFGSLDSSSNVGTKSLLDSKVVTGPGLMSSPGRFITSTPKKLKEMVLGDHGHESEPVDNRFASSSSTNSTCSDQSSCSLSAAVSQGMLKCSWKDGFPNYVFSVDDRGEVYLANLIKIQSPNEKALDYIYTFHSKSGGKRETEFSDDELNVIGQMKVSTSVTLCPKSSEITETQFVLSGASDNNSTVEIQTSALALRKNKGLTKKVADVFRTNQYRKLRTYSSFWGTNTVLENTSEDVVDKNPDQGLTNHAENFMPRNLELAALVVKDHICESPKKPQVGGWGLHFLKKSGTKQTNARVGAASVSSECNSQRGEDGGECSTSMDILIPAGFHGGPRTSAGGPSSLVERWKSGGSCDCGGWDVGCPLTVINAKVNRTESRDQTHSSGECITVDLIVKGSKQNAPIMKMANIHKDLYYIHFQSTLSALQCFAIAAAIIHSNSPALRPKLYRT